MAPALGTNTAYAWDVIITSPDGGSGVSRMARLVAFTNRGVQNLDTFSADWPFDEELPERPPENIEGQELLDALGNQAEGEPEADPGEVPAETTDDPTSDGDADADESGGEGETDAGNSNEGTDAGAPEGPGTETDQ